jgi:aspartyl-tRNA(Asn)/glutamyl-tRNA(Gln) amidotransferase subunit A
VSHNPSLVRVCRRESSGLPIGMQISGRRFGEAKALALAYAYEQATDWHTRWPHVV